MTPSGGSHVRLFGQNPLTARIRSQAGQSNAAQEYKR
jgi:hypothetical protein